MRDLTFLFPAFTGLGTGLGLLFQNAGTDITIGVAVGAALSLTGALLEERLLSARTHPPATARLDGDDHLQNN